MQFDFPAVMVDQLVERQNPLGEAAARVTGNPGDRLEHSRGVRIAVGLDVAGAQCFVDRIGDRRETRIAAGLRRMSPARRTSLHPERLHGFRQADELGGILATACLKACAHATGPYSPQGPRIASRISGLVSSHKIDHRRLGVGG